MTGMDQFQPQPQNQPQSKSFTLNKEEIARIYFSPPLSLMERAHAPLTI